MDPDRLSSNANAWVAAVRALANACWGERTPYSPIARQGIGVSQARICLCIGWIHLDRRS
jgi:hypothetical protein